MKQSIIHVALVVRDYDEAIEFYCQKLNFTLVEDTYQPEQDKRWVVVKPPGSRGTSLLLARAATLEQEQFIGKILTSITDMTNLVEKVLDAGRLDPLQILDQLSEEDRSKEARLQPIYDHFQCLGDGLERVGLGLVHPGGVLDLGVVHLDDCCHVSTLLKIDGRYAPEARS